MRAQTVIDLTGSKLNSSPNNSPPAKRTRAAGGYKSFHLNDLAISPNKMALDDALRAQKTPKARDVRILCVSALES